MHRLFFQGQLTNPSASVSKRYTAATLSLLSSACWHITHILLCST